MKTILGGSKKKGSSRNKASSSSSKDAKAKALIGKTIEVKNRRFKVKEILGEGGYSNVYRVVEEGSNNVFALKRMLVSVDEMDLVKREVSLMKSIPPHRNLVHFECANVTTSAEQRKGEDLMEANIIMEYADVRLFDVMEARHTEGKYFTEAELIAIMVDVCEGVAVLHQHRPPIAHRDIKVENVLLGNDGAYKLCDFGSATSVTHHPKTAAERDAAEADIERNTTMVYRAPEMLDLYAAKPIDEKADIWALGCMLYKMCFFEDAFSIGGRLAILQANFSFPLAPKYSPELNECIKYMLELNAEERPSITAVIRRLQRLKAGLGQDTPGKHRRSRTWGGSQDNLHIDDIPPAAANAEDKATSLHSSGASSNRERRKVPVVPRKTSSDLDTSIAASPPSPATEHKSSLRDSRRPRRDSGHGRRELHFDGPTAGSGATNGGIDPNPNIRGSPVSDRAFAFPAPPSHRKGSISASASPLLMPDTFPSPVLSPSSALKPGQLIPGGSPMMGMMSITPLGSGGTASLPHGLGGLSMVPLGSGGGSPSGGLTLTALPSGGHQGGLTMTPLASGNQGGLTIAPIPSGGGGGLTMTPLASGGNPGAGLTSGGASHHGGLTLSPLASGGGNQGQQGGLTMTALASGGNHGGGGVGLTMTPLVSGGGGGLTMTPLASGGNQGGLTMTPLISGGGGLTMTPLASGGNQGGLTMTPLASGGLTMTALASGGNQGGLTLAQRNSGGLSMNPLTSGGGNQGHGGLTMAPLTSGGKTGIPTPYSSAASNGYGGHSLSPLASGDGAMGGMSIKPLASGGTSRGPTTPTRAGAISKSSGGSGSGSGGGGGEMSIIPTISGSSREKEGKGEIITFEAMMKLIDREREEKDKRSHSADSIESDMRGEGQEQGGRKPTTGSSKKKKNKKTRREILPGGTISSSDEDGLNMLASGEHDFASEGSKSEQTKLKKLRKSLQMKEKGFKEIRPKESVDDTATTGGTKEKKANRKSKLFGKLGIEYAGEGPIDTDAGSHPDDEMSPFGVASSPTIPLSVALASTSKESKQAQFMNADIPLHQSFLKHSFDLDFVYTAEYLARKALAHGHRMWALAPADTPIEDVKIWAANGVTDSYFAHIKSRKLGNSYEECLRCLLSLFKMLQEGSPCVLLECYQHLAWLQNLRKTAKMQEKAQLVQLMCTFLVKKIEFHRHHPQFEGTYSLQTHHAQKRQRSEQYAVDQAGSFQELEDLLGVQQALMDIPNLILMQLDTYKDDLALETLPPLVAESHAILSMSTYLLVKLKVFCLDKDKSGTFQELKGSYKALYHVLSRFYSQILHYTNMTPSLVPVLPPKPKISALLNVQALQYPVRLKTLSREIPKVAGQMQHHDKEREKKERREREKREKDEKKREKERSKLEKKREKGMKKGMRLPGKKIGKADLKKELKREMQKEWEEELERESVRGRDTRPSVAEASSMIPASPPTADATTTSSNVEPLHSSVKRPVARRRLEPSMSSGAFQLPHQPQHPPHVHILGEEGRTVSLVEVPAITLQPEPEPHHSPLKRTHSRSKSYAGHEKVQINEFDVSRLISQQHPVYANASWNPFS